MSSFSRSSRNSSGFTLVELLVVIAIIGILIALLLPAVQAAREAARRTQCSNNLKQLTLGLVQHHSNQLQLPPGGGRDWNTSRGNCSAQGAWYGWTAYILPYLELGNLSDQLEFKVEVGVNPFPNDLNHVHYTVGRVPLSVLRCPSDPIVSKPQARTNGGGVVWWYDPAPTNYVASAGAHTTLVDDDYGPPGPSGCTTRAAQTGSFYIASARRFAHFRDGASNTMLLSECKIGHGYFYRGASWILSQYNAYWSYSTLRLPNDIVGDGWSGYSYQHYHAARSYHPGGVLVSMADGSVHFIGDSISIDLWRAMGTIASNDVVEPF